jgi:NAD dependent epimerase/dehydratase family enzyme
VLGRELAYELLFISERVKPSVLESSGFEFAHATLDAALRAVL